MPPVYDRLAKFYDRAFAPFERRFLAGWRAEALSLLPRDASILEIGAGTGANFAFYPQSKCAVASEISEKMLDRAAEKRLGQLLVQADAQSLPFDRAMFDAAFATLVFCSIPKPELAFGELERVVRPGGKIILLEHVRPDGFLGPVFDALNVLTVALVDDHFNRRTSEIAAGCGLRVTEIRRKAAGAVNLIICEAKE